LVNSKINDMKPTAVEFAVEQLEQLIPFGHQLAVRIILEQALEMEQKQKQEIRQKSYMEGYDDGLSDALTK
jgi:hypothetical protein